MKKRPAKVLKTDFVFARVAPSERALIQRAADAEYLSLSSWPRQTLLRAAAARLDEPSETVQDAADREAPR